MNKSIRKTAKELIGSRKKSLLPALISLLFASAGIFSVRIFLSDEKTVVAVCVGILFSAAFVFFRQCVNYRLQVQTVTAVNGGEIKIKAKEYLKNVLLSARLSLCKAAELVAFELLPILMLSLLFIGINIKGMSRKLCVIVLVGAAVIAATGFVFYVFSVQKYSKAPFFLAAYPCLTVSECIELSRLQSKEKAAELLRFKLGFLPWIPLCIAIFPLLYFIPYYKQSLTCFFIRRGF